MITLLKKLGRQLLGFLPTKLPVGTTEFETWIDSFFHTYDLATTDRDSIVHALATSIMHLGPQAHKKSKYFFYKVVQAGSAKQIAHHMFREMQLKKQEEQKKAAEEAAPTTNEPQK